ncbi:MAG: hypothetical protein HWE24_20965 [Oceanospirillaceae bacterium]|nr:hypothetical protein [Oceanospirillaceae bacterium]
MNVDIEKALKLFINEIRIFISTELSKEYGESWERKYFQSLNDGKQQETWSFWRGEVDDYTELIDYPNLASFASNSGFFKRYTRNGGRYAVKFSEISDCRNIVAHYITLDQNKVNLAFEHMISISIDLKLETLEKELTKLRGENVKQQAIEPIHTPKISTNIVTTSKSQSNTRLVDGMKIGAYVQKSMAKLSLSSGEIQLLQDRAFCLETFSMSHRVLIPNTESKKDSTGRNRYYKDEVVPGYWLCSQWVERQWDKYLDWEQMINNGIK